MRPERVNFTIWAKISLGDFFKSTFTVGQLFSIFLSLFTIRQILEKIWAIFLSNHLVTLFEIEVHLGKPFLGPSTEKIAAEE